MKKLSPGDQLTRVEVMGGRLGGRSCLPVLSIFSLRSTAPQWIYPDGIGGRLLLSGDWHCYLDASDWMELVWAGLLLLGEQVVNRHEFIH